ncbi:pyridoxamine kinase [Cellulosilyticum sp. I15G10I2]|uniref:pyridoxamine kinase n=1 Tax=Cellulosilyticum sp. I15G10I2 TaxID=1892843 RepID=UPI00085C4227|nr:pyridoxamine kinase [Cellulosilyticum sp. I15G10I2]
MKKVAVIHDLSGIGRCSLNAAISILAVLKKQPCPLPTAILSNQTGFKSFSFLDFTQYIKEYYSHWKKIGYHFDTIYSGFLGSIEQIELLTDFIKQFKTDKTLVMIDPVMGDNGKLYAVYPEDYPKHMRELIRHADVITPNFTEFTLLTGYDAQEEGINKQKLIACGRELAENGPQQIIVTGICSAEQPDHLYNLGMDFAKDVCFEVGTSYNNISYSGTGDIFASIVCGYLTDGYTLEESVKIAAEFIAKAIDYTSKYNLDTNEGIMYEIFLKELNI